MAETKTAERVEQAYNRAEDNMSSMMDNSRKTFKAMFDLNAKQMNTTLQFARDMQDESLRLTDAWFDQVSKFQKNTMKTFHDYTSRFQDYTEQTVRDTQTRVEEGMEQTMEMVSPAAARGRRR